MSLALALAALSLAVWLYLLLGRGWFWRPYGGAPAPPPRRWPSVVAVVPARNEAAAVGDAVASLLAQDYAGSFRIVLVDDHSSDGTAVVARAAASSLGKDGQLALLSAPPLAPGWTGKLWALSAGVEAVEAGGDPPELYLFTDADIVHSPDDLAGLVARAETEGRDLVSLMVRLRCCSAAERLLIPAFVFFFAMLYPFRWSNDPRPRHRGGGGRLRADPAQRLSPHRRAGVDQRRADRRLRAGEGGEGERRLDLARPYPHDAEPRPYPGIGDVWRMVARTAYTQLGYSPLLLAGTVLGLIVTYLAPVVLVFAGGRAAWLAAAAWAAMTLAYLPMVRFYALSPLWALLLPAAASVYLAATVDSARRYWQGAGGEWKGRVEWRRRS